MKKFVWEDKYSLGIASVDEQHKTFFEILNEVAELTKHPNDPDLRSGLVIALVKFGNYAFYHLSYEEEYFIKFAYKDREDHETAHEIYRGKITEYLKRIKNADTDLVNLAEETAQFGQDWLKFHILDMDKKYVDLFLQHDMH